jgi:hypothetical protein
MNNLSVLEYCGQEKWESQELIVRAIRQRDNTRSAAHQPSVADGPFRLLVYMQALQRRYGRCVPANRKMAEHFDVSVRTIQRWKRELESAGLIRQERRKRAHHQEQRSAYHILVDSKKCRTRQLVSSNEMSPLLFPFGELLVLTNNSGVGTIRDRSSRALNGSPPPRVSSKKGLQTQTLAVMRKVRYRVPTLRSLQSRIRSPRRRRLLKFGEIGARCRLIVTPS